MVERLCSTERFGGMASSDSEGGGHLVWSPRRLNESFGEGFRRAQYQRQHERLIRLQRTSVNVLSSLVGARCPLRS
jgi:hypothetical protein